MSALVNRAAGMMRAFVINNYGGHEAAVVSADIAKPTIKNPDDVVIKVHASSVNPVDIQLCTGYGKKLMNFLRRMKLGQQSGEGKEFPIILGRDFAGIVEETGEKAVKFKAGDEVYGSGELYQNGGMAEYVVVKELTIAKKPSNISFEEAASVPYTALTFWSSSVGTGAIGPDKTQDKRVLIHAGTGGVGSFAIQLVKAWGGYVVTTCGTSGIEMVKALGADEVIDYRKEKFEEVLKGKPKFDFVLSSLRSDDMLNNSLNLLKRGGMCSTLYTPTMYDTDNYGVILGGIKAMWSYFTSTTGQKFRGRGLAWGYYGPNGEALETIGTLIEQGKIKPQVEKVFSLDEAAKGYAHVAEGHAKGKTVIKITE